MQTSSSPRVRRPGAGLTACAAALIAPIILSGCAPPESGQAALSDPQRVVYGEAVPLGNGTARSYLVLENGAPAELGVALSEAALTGLPTNDSEGGVTMPDGMKTFEFELPLPSENPTAYQTATLDWNPGGHEPPGIYDVPHFDFHFYTITSEQRHAIHPGDARFMEKAAVFPAAEYLPAGYVMPELNPIPMMGLHWVDPKSPELSGQPFEKTFIYGTWDGQLIFAEPMVTRAFLESKPDFSAPINVPERQVRPGLYPSSYVVRWDEPAKEYRVAVSGFQHRD